MRLAGGGVLQEVYAWGHGCVDYGEDDVCFVAYVREGNGSDPDINEQARNVR